MKEIIGKHPVLATLLIIISTIAFIWWMSQPVEIIYDPNAPSFYVDDDPEGGYFPRR